MPFTQKDIGKNSRFESQIAVAVCLLFFVALVSLIGTLPTEPLPFEVQGSQIANAFIAFTRFSGGRSLYASPFFICFLGLFGLFVGSAIIGQIKSHFSPAAPVVFGPLSRMRLSSAKPQSIKCRLEKALSLFGYRLKFFDGEKRIEGAKNLWGKLGPLGIHLGFVIVLLAGLVTLRGADIRETEVSEGDLLTLPKEKRALRLDKFIVFRHAGSDRPSQYTSRFWLKDENGKGRHVDLSVNHPLQIGRTKLFQMRYRIEIPKAEILIHQNGKPVEQILLEAGKPQELSPGGPTVLYDKIIPDFKLTKDGIISTGTSYERSAMRLKIQEKAGTEEAIWIFPTGFGSHGGSENKRQFSILKLHKVHTSGVRISYDPGLFLAYPGLFLLIFSAFCSSFVIPRRLRLTWDEEVSHEIELRVEGWCPRDPLGLQDEANRLVSSIKGKSGSKPLCGGKEVVG